MDHEFSVGDVVRMKSGGPQMTVSDTPGPMGDIVICEWMTGDGRVRTRHFSPRILAKVDDGPKTPIGFRSASQTG